MLELANMLLLLWLVPGCESRFRVCCAGLSGMSVCTFHGVFVHGSSTLLEYRLRCPGIGLSLAGAAVLGLSMALGERLYFIGFIDTSDDAPIQKKHHMCYCVCY